MKLRTVRVVAAPYVKVPEPTMLMMAGKPMPMHGETQFAAVAFGPSFCQ